MEPTIAEHQFRVFAIRQPTDLIALITEVLGWQQPQTIVKLCSMVGDKVRTVIVEDYYVDKDFKSMLSFYYSKIFAPTDKAVKRLLFFESDIKGINELYTIDRDHQAGFLGFVTCYYNGTEQIGRSVLGFAKLGHKIKICSTTFDCNFLGSRLVVKGFPYIQQDTNVMACAQASIWMMMRYYSTKYNDYAEKYPSDIVQADKDFSA